MEKRIMTDDRKWKLHTGGAEEMVKDLKANVFPDRAINFVAVTKDGKKEVRVV